MSLSVEGQNLSANKIWCWPDPSNLRAILHQGTKFPPNNVTRGGVMMSYTISRWRLRWLNTSYGFVLVDVTDQIWKVNLYPRSKFHGNRTTRSEDNDIIDFKDGSRGGTILLPVSYFMTLLSSEGQKLSANQIWSSYLNPRMLEKQTSAILEFYFRFWFRRFNRNRRA